MWMKDFLDGCDRDPSNRRIVSFQFEKKAGGVKISSGYIFLNLVGNPSVRRGAEPAFSCGLHWHDKCGHL